MKKSILLIFLLGLVQSMTIAQTSIAVKTLGSGDPILYLPGFANPGEIWNETSSQLPKHAAHVVTYAGFGGVTPVEMPWYEKLKADLVNYMVTNNLSKVTVIGHSIGGSLALDLAASLPDRIQKLVIVDALACMREILMPGVPADALGYGGPYIEQMLAMDEAANSSYLDQLTQNMISKPEDKQVVKNWMTGADRETFVYGYVDLLKLDSRPLLSSIKVPVLVMVAGQPYGSGALDTVKKQYQGLERKEFAFAQDSKHYLMLDAKDWFIGEVTSFLAK